MFFEGRGVTNQHDELIGCRHVSKIFVSGPHDQFEPEKTRVEGIGDGF